MLAQVKGRHTVVLATALATLWLGVPAAHAAALCNGLPATIEGTSGDDTITGTSGKDVIVAKGGNDTVRGLGGADVICGGAGADLLIGNDGVDTLFGGSGNDTLEGRDGADRLDGEGGKDTLIGNRGRDVLVGGPGTDTADGGSSVDACTAESEARCEDDDPWYYTTPTPKGSGDVIDVAPTDSLTAAVAGVSAGETLRLLPGTHSVSGNLVLRNSGTKKQWVRIIAAPGTRPVIDLTGSGEFRISASFVLLEGVAIRNGGGNNLHIAPEASSITDIVVRNTVISDLVWGPGAAIKINRNNPQGAGVSRVYLERNDVSEAIDNAVIDGVGVSRAVVRDNWIHDNDVGSHGVFFKGGSSRILLERNLVSGIRGNAALQLGGNTGAGFFDPQYANWEGFNQVARNNLIADFDDSAVEIRGVKNGTVVHNTIVTQTTFAIFRMSTGWTNGGGASGNANLSISSNLVVGTGGNPQYARNDGGPASITFGPQLWAGVFRNSGSSTPNVPQFPQPADLVVGAGSLPSVLVDPTTAGHTGVADAAARYTPAPASVGVDAIAWRSDAVLDFRGVVRAPMASFGAIEDP